MTLDNNEAEEFIPEAPKIPKQLEDIKSHIHGIHDHSNREHQLPGVCPLSKMKVFDAKSLPLGTRPNANSRNQTTGKCKTGERKRK
eukprot:jgi/Psemu1/17896/gm1.17896_g